MQEWIATQNQRWAATEQFYAANRTEWAEVNHRQARLFDLYHSMGEDIRRIRRANDSSSSDDE